jgi:hypothetical protein
MNDRIACSLIIGISIVVAAILIGSKMDRYEITIGNAVNYAVDKTTGAWWVLENGKWTRLSKPWEVQAPATSQVSSPVPGATGSDPDVTRSAAE